MLNSAAIIAVILLSGIILYMYLYNRPLGRLIRLKITVWTNLLNASFLILVLKLKRLF
jgi:hypothetical protein